MNSSYKQQQDESQKHYATDGRGAAPELTVFWLYRVLGKAEQSRVKKQDTRLYNSQIHRLSGRGQDPEERRPLAKMVRNTAFSLPPALVTAQTRPACMESGTQPLRSTDNITTRNRAERQTLDCLAPERRLSDSTSKNTDASEFQINKE